jgi:uncharacterized cupredoxin-like copper-binding protein
MNREWVAALSALLVGGAIAGSIMGALALSGGGDAEAQVVREYVLEIVPQDIDYGNGNVWHAWTYRLQGEEQGTVPGPTLHVTAGERLRVRVINRLDIVHSFHTHLSNYDQEDDGSQTNIISGVGSGAMIPPGGEWTYEFEPTEPGLFYYHCHSADGGLLITQHIHQGLYGAIVVHAPDEPPVREEVVFMAEIGHETEGERVPTFIMNGMGLPGGEHALEAAYHEGGFDAVAAQLNRTVPAFTAEVGEELRVHIVNIGDQIHTFHAHNVNHFSEQALAGRMWPANVVPLLPGAADTVRLTFTKPGIWLFHCHVVNHADAGMIGVFIIEEAGAPPPAPSPTPAAPTPTSGAARPTATSEARAGPVPVSLSEWRIAGPGGAALPQVAAGAVTLNVRNDGSSVHELAVIETDRDPDDLPISSGRVDEDAAGELIARTETLSGGATARLELDLAPGAYVLICNVPTHYELGMRARLVVR